MDTSQHDREDPTPTYADAMSNDRWRIICPRLPRETLCKMLWVSRSVSAHARQALWHDPAKFFQNRPAGPIVSFARFRAVVDRAYPMRTDTSILPPTERTRQLTRVLDLRALAGVALVEGANYRQWLHSLLLGLRNVRCVLFEDYAPLNADCLLYLSMRHDWDLDGSSRMLVARAMHIPTSRYLGQFVLGFATVSYLDLSKTTCAGDHAFLNVVALSGFFRNVGILKLRGVKLDDQGLLTIISGANRSIWSLDVRNNLLTYQSLIYLLAFSVQRPRHDPGNEYSRYVEGEDQPDRAIKYLSNGRTKGILRGTGLTHLRIADNGPFLAEDVATLLASDKLVAVDIGIAWPSRQTSSGRLVPFSEPSAGSAQLRDRIAPPLADPITHHIGRSMRYERLHHTFITGQCLGHDDDLDIITQLASGPEDTDRVGAMMVKDDFIWKVAQTGITELVLMDLPAVSRVGFLSRGLQVFISKLARLETEDEHMRPRTLRIPTTLRKLVLEFRPSAVPKVFGHNSKPPDIPLRHIPPTGAISDETPDQVPWDGLIPTTLRRYWRADTQRWSGEVLFRAADSEFFWNT